MSLRKGAHRRDWTTKELSYLRSNAGVIPVRQICKHLKRSKDAVEWQARKLGLSLRCYNRKLQWCPICAKWRSTVSQKTGICRVCAKKKMLADSEERISRALEQLTPEQREKYNEQEVHRRSRIPLKPVKQVINPKYRYQYAKEEERYDRALEDWEIQCLNLRIDANKTRLRRIRNKSGTNPRKKSD